MARENPALARHIDKIFPSLDALFAAGEDVETMAVGRGWEAVSRVLQAEVDATYAELERPGVHEQAVYAAAHGRVGGLKAAQAAVDAIVARAERRQREQRDQHEASDTELSPAGR